MLRVLALGMSAVLSLNAGEMYAIGLLDNDRGAQDAYLYRVSRPSKN
jgi:hypothetical protein